MNSRGRLENFECLCAYCLGAITFFDEKVIIGVEHYHISCANKKNKNSGCAADKRGKIEGVKV